MTHAICMSVAIYTNLTQPISTDEFEALTTLAIPGFDA